MPGLDDIRVYKRLDVENMRQHLHNLPQQCRAAWRKATDFKLPKDYAKIDKVVVLGMGGSAIGGDLVSRLLASKGKPVMLVNRDYDLPGFVDDTTLVIASSYSGNTEEMLSAFSQALKSNCKTLAMTTGGRLRAIAEEAGVPVFIIDYVAPPRAALGYSLMPIMAFLQNLGLLKGKTVEVETMIKDLEKSLTELKETVPTKSNRAKQVAAKLYGKIAVIYGAGILSQVAHRWKTQINENGKAWAFYEGLPELNHNAVVGYQFPKELAAKIFVVLLRCRSVHARNLLRYQITSEILKEQGIGHEIIDGKGETKFSQMMGLIYLGDWVSYYLAVLNGVNPTPVKAIDYVKKRLRKAT